MCRAVHVVLCADKSPPRSALCSGVGPCARVVLIICLGWWLVWCQAYLLLVQKQLPARGANQLLTQVGTVVAYGCVALPLVTVGHLGSQGMSPDALFNVVGECGWDFLDYLSLVVHPCCAH